MSHFPLFWYFFIIALIPNEDINVFFPVNQGITLNKRKPKCYQSTFDKKLCVLPSTNRFQKLSITCFPQLLFIFKYSSNVQQLAKSITPNTALHFSQTLHLSEGFGAIAVNIAQGGNPLTLYLNKQHSKETSLWNSRSRLFCLFRLRESARLFQHFLQLSRLKKLRHYIAATNKLSVNE